MPRGRTNSSMGIGARREKARDLFSRGFTNSEVARECEVSLDTAARYRRMYEAEIKDMATANPRLLQDVLANTVRTLRELDQIRAEAWKRYESASGDSAKAGWLRTALKAQEQRAKLFQLFGVKAEYMAQVALIQRQQTALMEFLSQSSWCEADRERIIDFLARQVDTSDLEALSETAEPTLS